MTIDARLFALDAGTGVRKWEVNLREGLRIPPREFSEYQQTSPPCVVGDIVVVGSSIADNGRTQMASGEVRGFDVATGKRLWTWDPIPPSVEAAKAPGGANAWSVITADPKRGHVYVPTGSPSPDYYGGLRKELNHANSVVALEARTGKMVWHFQTVHHDLWDYDVALHRHWLKQKAVRPSQSGPRVDYFTFWIAIAGSPFSASKNAPFQRVMPMEKSLPERSRSRCCQNPSLLTFLACGDPQRKQSGGARI